MNRFAFAAPLRRLLVIGAHCDDGEIGCGGTVARLIREHPAVRVRWVVLGGSDAVRVSEARASAQAWLAAAAEPEIAVESFRDSFFPWQGAEIKGYFEGKLKPFDPDLVLTHWSGDAHQDHRLVSELTWNTFRDHAVLEYEIPKVDGDLGRPNVYVALGDDEARRKVDHILAAFPSQAARPWFTADLFLGLMRLRGMETGTAARHAEAFHGKKVVV